MKQNKDIEAELKKLILETTDMVTPAVEVAPAHKLNERETSEAEAGKAGLTQIHEGKLLYRGRLNNYYVQGDIPQDMAVLKIMLIVTEDTSDIRGRYKVDLYEEHELLNTATAIAGIFLIEKNEALKELHTLTSLLEQYRDKRMEMQQRQFKKVRKYSTVSADTEKDTLLFLSAKNLRQRTEKLLAEAGIKEGDSVSLFLYLAAMSYKNDTPLHVSLKGNQSGVRSLIQCIGRFVPEEDTLLLNNVSARSLYHCSQGELMNKTVLLPDGMDKKARYAFEQLQKGDTITTATTVKDRLSNMTSAIKKVESHFSSLFYSEADNTDTSISLNLSGSNMDDVVAYNNRKLAGLIDEQKENEALTLLCNVISCIKPLPVINPHAQKVVIPCSGERKVGINLLYQSLVKLVCLYHQYQRSKDALGRMVAEPIDMQTAAELMFSVMPLGADDLDIDNRRFYEQVKEYVKRTAGDNMEAYAFSMREIRQGLKVTKNYCFRYMEELREMEYVQRTGYANRGFKYKVACWDAGNKEHEEIRSAVEGQLQKLITETTPVRRTPGPDEIIPEPPKIFAAHRSSGSLSGGGLCYDFTLNEREHTYKPKKRKRKK